MVKALTQFVAKSDPQASTFVHWGATSQDAIDTGLALQLRAAFDLLDRDLSHHSDALARLCGGAQIHPRRRPHLVAAGDLPSRWGSKPLAGSPPSNGIANG